MTKFHSIHSRMGGLAQPTHFPIKLPRTGCPTRGGFTGGPRCRWGKLGENWGGKLGTDGTFPSFSTYGDWGAGPAVLYHDTGCPTRGSFTGGLPRTPRVVHHTIRPTTMSRRKRHMTILPLPVTCYRNNRGQTERSLFFFEASQEDSLLPSRTCLNPTCAVISLPEIWGNMGTDGTFTIFFRS